MDKIKILVAEDEKLIREGIIKSINWDVLGAEVIGQAKNGVQALRQLKEKMPDILISDIKMGGGNGLDLIREAKVINAELRVVIISGYNSFDYAQQAIQLGVQDYLLKPVVIEDLEKVLLNLIEKINTKKSVEVDQAVLDEKQNRNHQILIDQYYRELIYGIIPKNEIIPKADEFEVDISKEFYICTSLFLEIKDTLKWGETKNDLRAVLEDFCLEHKMKTESILLTPNELYHSDISIVFSSNNKILLPEEMMKKISGLFRESQELTLLALGFGAAVSKMQDLHFSHQAARTQAYFSLISGLNSKNKSEAQERHEFPVNIYETTKELYQIFSKSDLQEMNSFLSRTEMMIKDGKMDIEKRTGIMRNLLVCILSAGDELGIAVKDIFPDLMVLFRFINMKSLDEMFDKFKWACDTIISQQQTREDRMSINLMEKAKSTIIKKYTDPLLSLDSISSELSITPAYFSKLYKKYHGVSYIEFLTQLRLEKAKELLKSDSSVKISAVAFMVGYNSSSYFNYIFKKTYKLTPREFQKALRPN